MSHRRSHLVSAQEFIGRVLGGGVITGGPVHTLDIDDDESQIPPGQPAPTPGAAAAAPGTEILMPRAPSFEEWMASLRQAIFKVLDGTEACSICTEAIDCTQRWVITKCNHSFCAKCAVKYIQAQAT